MKDVSSLVWNPERLIADELSISFGVRDEVQIGVSWKIHSVSGFIIRCIDDEEEP